MLDCVCDYACVCVFDCDRGACGLIVFVVCLCFLFGCTCGLVLLVDMVVLFVYCVWNCACRVCSALYVFFVVASLDCVFHCACGCVCGLIVCV